MINHRTMSTTCQNDTQIYPPKKLLFNLKREFKGPLDHWHCEEKYQTAIVSFVLKLILAID